MRIISILVGLGCQIVFVLFGAGSGWSQEVHVPFRLAVSAVADGKGNSFFVYYELGSISIAHGAKRSFVKFERPVPDTSFVSFFRSVPFEADDSSDTLSFFRYASFVDAQIPRSYDITDPNNPSGYDTAAFNRYNKIVTDRLVLNRFSTVPSASAFDPISYLFYIVEIRRVSDGAVVARIDTLHCYRDPQGRLKFTVYPLAEGQTRRVSLYHLPLHTPLYLTTSREISLPAGASIARDEFERESEGKSDGKDEKLSDDRSKPGDRLDPYDPFLNPDAQLDHLWRPYRPR